MEMSSWYRYTFMNSRFCELGSHVVLSVPVMLIGVTRSMELPRKL